MISLYVLALDDSHAQRLHAALGDGDIQVRWVDGRGAQSFSWLVNQTICQADHEFVLCASDRVAPNCHDVYRMVQLLQDGYGWVGLFRFAFFGLWKELVRRIGFMDEEYGNGAEDGDYYFRIGEADIAMYEGQEVPYAGGTSRWLHQDRPRIRESLALFYEKWGFRLQETPPVVERQRAELPATLDVACLGPSLGRVVFRPHRDSVLIPGSSSRLVHADWRVAEWRGVDGRRSHELR